MDNIRQNNHFVIRRIMECGCIDTENERGYKFLTKQCPKHPKGYLSKDWHKGKIVSQRTFRRNGV